MKMFVWKWPRRCWAAVGLAAALLAAMASWESLSPALGNQGTALVQPSAAATPVMERQRPKRTVYAPIRQRAAAAFIAGRYRIEASQAGQWVKIAHAAARRMGIDPLLLLAIIAVESAFNPYAVSVAGAEGLMQIIPHYHPEKFDSDNPHALFDPETNISVGARILKEYLSEAEDMTLALQRYAGALADREAAYAERIFHEVDRIREAIGAGSLAVDDANAGARRG